MNNLKFFLLYRVPKEIRNSILGHLSHVELVRLINSDEGKISYAFKNYVLSDLDITTKEEIEVTVELLKNKDVEFLISSNKLTSLDLFSVIKQLKKIEIEVDKRLLNINSDDYNFGSKILLAFGVGLGLASIAFIDDTKYKGELISLSILGCTFSITGLIAQIIKHKYGKKPFNKSDLIDYLSRLEKKYPKILNEFERNIPLMPAKPNMLILSNSRITMVKEYSNGHSKDDNYIDIDLDSKLQLM